MTAGEVFTTPLTWLIVFIAFVGSLVACKGIVGVSSGSATGGARAGAELRCFWSADRQN
jgi:hypothetical protein